MKKLILSCLFIFSSNVFALDLKIGVIDEQTIFENSSYGKNYQETMQKELQKRQEQFAKKEEELQKKHENFRRDKDILSAKERTEKEKELVATQQELQSMHEKLELELKKQDQKEHQKIGEIFKNAINKIAKEEKCDLVISINILLYKGDNIVDLTDKVIKELDQSYKANKNAIK